MRNKNYNIHSMETKYEKTEEKKNETNAPSIAILSTRSGPVLQLIYPNFVYHPEICYVCLCVMSSNLFTVQQ